MGCKPRISTRNLRSRSSFCNSRRKCRRPVVCRENGGASVSDKMEALKNLIPGHGEELNPDQLFQETADYIVHLKSQVLVLQKLVGFYESPLLLQKPETPRRP